MPRGWISRLKKIPRPWNLTLTYLLRYSRRWYSQKIFSNRKYFFSNLQTCKYRVFWKNIVIKMPHGWISRFKKSHDLEIWTRPTCRGILGDVFAKKIFSDRKWKISKYRSLFWKNIKLPFVNSKKILPVGKYFFANTINDRIATRSYTIVDTIA